MTVTSPSKRILLLAALLSTLPTAYSEIRWRWHASRMTSLDFGICPDPGITWDYDLDGSEQYGFSPTDQTQFPHGFSSDISTLEVYICNRLQSICDASEPAIEACQNAFELYSGLSGQNAADSWNEALGLYGSMPLQTYDGTTITALATVLVSGTSVPYSTLFSAVSTVYSESVTSAVLSSYVPPTYTIYSTQTISQGLGSTSTVQSITSPTATLTSTSFIPLSTLSTTAESVSTSIIVPTGGTSVTTTTLVASSVQTQSTSTGTGSGDGGGSPFSGRARVLEPLRGLFMACFVVPALLTLFV